MGLTKPRAHQLQDIDYKQTARAVTTSNVTLSGGAPATVDGVSLALRDRILVTGQSTGSENGIYYVTTVGAGSNGTWARSLDADTTGEVSAGMIIMVTEGTTYADTQWKLTTDDPITIGTTSLTFVRNGNAAYGTFAVSGEDSIVADTIGDTLTIVAGTNLALTTNASTDTLTITPSLTPSLTSVTATGNITGGNITTGGDVDATGNITAASFAGSGALLSALNGSNITTGTVAAARVATLNQNTTGTAGGLSSAVTVSLTGAVTGSATFTNAGDTASISTTATSDPTITLTGDVTGSGTMTNLGDVSFATTIAANSVALGTDTTGNYVGTITGGTGIASSGATTGEGVAHTLSVDLSELTDMTAAMVGTDEFIVLDAGADRRKAANEIGLSIFNNDSGFTTNTGTVTSVSGGTGLSGTVTSSGSLSIDNTVATLTGSQTLTNKTLTSPVISSISNTGTLTLPTSTGTIALTSDIPTNNNQLTNGAGYTTNVGDITGVTAGVGLSGGGSSGSVTLTVDLSELTDMTAAMVGTDEFIVLDAGADRRKAANEIGLSIFSNDAGFTTNTGDITNVSVSGTGLSGGGASGSVTITSNATSANTGSTIVARDGSGNFSAGVITATATQARYADLAEKYTSDQDYEPGTVVELGGEYEVTQTRRSRSTAIAGVVSTDPAYLMNNDLDGISVALIGRVPCKVVGTVRKGDMLISSDEPGHAQAYKDIHNPPTGSVIGKAIENKDNDGPGVIEVLVGRL